MFRYETEEIKRAEDRITVQVKLDDKGIWSIDDVCIRKPRQRQGTYQRIPINEAYRYKIFSSEERREKVNNALINMIGQELYEQIVLEAWNSIKPVQ